MDGVSFVILLVAISFGVFGQLSLKHGMKEKKTTHAREFLKQAINPFVAGGFAFYGISTLLYFLAIAKLDLSLAYPTVSLGYVAVVYLSRLLLNERFSGWRWAALVLICVGVAMVGFGG